MSVYGLWSDPSQQCVTTPNAAPNDASVDLLNALEYYYVDYKLAVVDETDTFLTLASDSFSIEGWSNANRRPEASAGVTPSEYGLDATDLLTATTVRFQFSKTDSTLSALPHQPPVLYFTNNTDGKVVPDQAARRYFNQPMQKVTGLTI